MVYKIGLYPERIESIKNLSLEDKWKLLDNILCYANDIDIPHKWYLEVVFNFMKIKFDYDRENYENRCEINREVWKKGGRPKKTFQNPVGFSETHRNPKKPQKPNSNSKSNNIYNNNISFVHFWDLYDKKIWKPKCEKKWNKLSEKEKEAIIAHIPNYKISQPDKKYRKNPETYLNNRSREDEIITDWLDYTKIENFHTMMMENKVPELKKILWVDKYFEIKKLRKESPFYSSF